MEILENKTIKVKPIKKNRAFLKDGHDGEIRYTGCTSGYKLPWKNKINSFVKIFNKEEQEAYEQALGLNPGTLNLFTRKGSWFSSHNVELTKEETDLNLMNPIQSLEYRILKADPSIANSKAEYNGTQDYYLEDSTVSQEEDYKLSETKEEAMEIFMKIRKSDKQMYDLLRVLGKGPSQSMKSNPKSLKAEIGKVIDQIEKVTGQPNINDLIKTYNDKLFQDRIFVHDAIELGEIETSEGVYKFKETGHPLGRSIEEVAEYFHSPKNQDDKLLIQQRLELNNN